MSGKGYWSDQSAIRQINREFLLPLAGPRALILQVSHAGIALGVQRHSEWQAHPLRRFYRTLWLLNSIIFGSKSRADRAITKIAIRHQPVRGKARPGYTSSARQTVAYSAAEPAARWWVIATLIDSSLAGYETWIGELSESDKQSCYTDWCRMADLFGIPGSQVPVDYAAFQDYMSGVWQGPAFAHNAASAQEIDAILSMLARYAPPFRDLTLGLLPESVRELYDLPLSAPGRIWTSLGRTGLKIYRALPPIFRQSPFVLAAKMSL